MSGTPRDRPTLFHLRDRAFRGAADLARVPGFRLLDHPRDLTRADAVVVHLPGLLAAGNDPRQLRALRRIAPPGQLWVAEFMESPALYPALDDPDFMALFDLEMSHRQAAEIWTPYLPHDFAARIAPPPPRRRRLCCAFVSSRFDESGRRALLRELMGHMEIHSCGRVLNNRRLFLDRGRASKLRALARYRYTLAFENSIAPDYVTEKVFDALIAGAVPVVLGTPNIAEFAPGKDSYVDATAFATPAALAAYLKATDPARHHAWRRRPLAPAFMAKLDRVRTGWAERLAAALRGRMVGERGRGLPRTAPAP